MANDYSNPVWLSNIARIMQKQARHQRDEGHRELLAKVASRFEAQASALRGQR